MVENINHEEVLQYIATLIIDETCHSSYDLGLLEKGRKIIESRFGIMATDRNKLENLLKLIFDGKEELPYLDYLAKIISFCPTLEGAPALSGKYGVLLGAYVKEEAIRLGMMRKEKVEDILMLYLKK